ncbi:hypothetical protein ABT300_28295 [Streptomyces sp. NPDC001027]|uniref:hypothetical protein n=1 Tax=Streptomyces sp. NPDC001027 TaxID=3154771 RepID=UPI00332C7D7E
MQNRRGQFLVHTTGAFHRLDVLGQSGICDLCLVRDFARLLSRRATVSAGRAPSAPPTAMSVGSPSNDAPVAIGCRPAFERRGRGTREAGWIVRVRHPAVELNERPSLRRTDAHRGAPVGPGRLRCGEPVRAQQMPVSLASLYGVLSDAVVTT